MLKSHQTFFEKALAIQAQRREKLTEAEKKEIALELGFSEADWQAVLDSFQSHLERGKAFLERENYQEALPELQEALILQPENTEVLSRIAWAHLGLFRHKKRKQDKEKALQYARECLQYAPDNFLAHQVIDAFNSTKTYHNVYPPIRTAAQGKQKTETTVALVVAAVIIVLISSVVYLNKRNQRALEESAKRKQEMKAHKEIEKAVQKEQEVSQKKKQEKIIEQQYDTQKIPDGSSKKTLPLSVGFTNKAKDYCTFHKQNDSTWLVTDLKGSNLFLIHIVKSDAQVESYTKKGVHLSSKLTYASLFYLRFLSDKVQKQYFSFEPEWKGVPIKNVNKGLFLSPYVPDYLNYQKGDEAYFSFYTASELADTLNLQAELIFTLKTNPERMKPYQKPMNLEIDKQAKTIKVLYEGKAYQNVAFTTRAIGFWQNEKKLNLGITFEIHNRDPQKRKLKTLEYEMRFYKQNRSDTLAQDALYKISKVISPNMGTPHLHFGKKTFYHANKTVFADSYQDIAPYYEIHISKLEWE